MIVVLINVTLVPGLKPHCVKSFEILLLKNLFSLGEQVALHTPSLAWNGNFEEAEVWPTLFCFQPLSPSLLHGRGSSS